MRFGIPLMVLTSLSLHIILLLIWLLEPGHRGAGAHAGPVPGPVIILSKEITPDRPVPAPAPQPPPPAPARQPVLAATKTVAKPARAPAPPLDPDKLLAGGGGPHLEGGVVFILDISGSMYEPYAGATRLALARKFLDRQIAALPDGTPFAIALYGETTRRSGPLVPARPATRAAAAHYLGEDFNCGGGTNLAAGLDAAEDLRPAGLVLVTDGDLNVATDKLLADARRILGQPGPQLSVFAIAPRRNTDDAAILQELVRQQAGTYQAMDVPGARESATEPAGGNH